MSRDESPGGISKRRYRQILTDMGYSDPHLEDADGWNADVKQLWQDMGCCASSKHGNQTVPSLVRCMDHASAVPGMV